MRWIARICATLALALAGPALGAAAVRVEVRAPGLERAQVEALKASLDLYAERSRKTVQPARVARLHRRAPDELRTALEALGYYRAEISPHLERDADGTWQARYAVIPGPPLPVASAEVRVLGPGRDDPALTTAVQAFPLRPGDRLDHGAYAAGKAALARAAADRGYLEARFAAHRVEVDLRAYQARVVLDLDSGPRYRFGAVHFEPTVVRDRLLHRYVPFAPGAPYTSGDVLALQNALADSPYFASVDVQTTGRDPAAHTVDLRVSTAARPRTRYRVGGGFATDTGPRLTTGFERRYVNRRGHRLDGEMRLSPVDSALTTTYTIPRGNPATDAWALGLSGKRTDTDTARADSLTLGAARTGLRWGWREALGVDYLIESFTTGEDEGNSRLLLPSWRLNRVDAPDPLHPPHGRRLSAELRGASAQLLSDVSLVQLRLGAKQIFSPAARQRVLLRADAGTSWTGEFETLPPSLRFYAGGDQSVRGYDLNSLGPTDDEDDVVGGRHLLVASGEYEYTVRPNWAVATFYDAGNAFDFGAADLRHGAGVGLRWFSPVGPVRVDFARALSDAQSPLRVHLTIGPDL